MDLYLLFHSVVVHAAAAMVILVYIPLSVPVKLFVWAFVKPFRKEDLRGKVVLITGASSGIGELNSFGIVHLRELAYQYAKKGACLALVARRKQALEGVAVAARERGAADVLVLVADVSDADESRRAIEETLKHFGKLNHLVANAGIWYSGCFDQVTSITAFNKIMDVNFWGSVYPTYYALPHLKASKGKLVVCCSITGAVPTPITSLYNATKAAQLRFYESLRNDPGLDVGITILTPGFVQSEITQGKTIQNDGQIAVNEEARDAMVGMLPVGRVETLCEIALESIRKGDWYVTWPSMYRPLKLLACLAPEVLNWISHKLHGTRSGNQRTLSQRIAEATGARTLYPSSLLDPAGIKSISHG